MNRFSFHHSYSTQGLGVWACVMGVQGPVEWEGLQRTEAKEEAYRIAGVVVSLVPAALVVMVTVFMVLQHTKVSPCHWCKGSGGSSLPDPRLCFVRL